jgi:hypothetical protein
MNVQRLVSVVKMATVLEECNTEEQCSLVRIFVGKRTQCKGYSLRKRLSALCAGRHLPPERFLVLVSVRGWVYSRAIVRLEGLGKLKKSTSSGLETATFRLVA